MREGKESGYPSKCSVIVAAIIGGIIIVAIIAQGRSLTMPSLTFFYS